MIRSMRLEDTHHLAQLHANATQSSPQALDRGRAVFETLFPQLFMHNPCVDERVGSLVSEEPDGTITGMIGVMARQMLFRDKPITMAVSAELYVDPAYRSSMAGLQLLKTFLDGPKDLSITDIANNKTRKIWERLRGIIAPLYGVNWFRPIQPSRFACELAIQSTRSRILRLASPLAHCADAVITRFKKNLLTIPPQPDSRREPLTPANFTQFFEHLAAEDALRPIFNQQTTDWVWQRFDYLHRDSGPSREVLVRNNAGEPVGWFIYQVKSGGIGRVSQIVATRRSASSVLAHLLHDAKQVGAVGVMGRVQPQLLQAYLEQSCFYLRRKTHTLVHSRNPAILDAFRCGNAFLTMLEGEGCLQIWNDPMSAIARMPPRLPPDPEQVTTNRLPAIVRA